MSDSLRTPDRLHGPAVERLSQQILVTLEIRLIQRLPRGKMFQILGSSSFKVRQYVTQRYDPLIVAVKGIPESRLVGKRLVITGSPRTITIYGFLQSGLHSPYLLLQGTDQTLLGRYLPPTLLDLKAQRSDQLLLGILLLLTLRRRLADRRRGASPLEQGPFSLNSG